MKKHMRDLKYGGNMYLIIVYDIKQEYNYAKRQRNVFKTCKKYLKHIQNSVFEGELDKAQYIELTVELKKYLKKDIDSCLVFSGRNNIWMRKEFITKREDDDDQFL
jgi:CRISPR-associated protein Cas2